VGAYCTGNLIVNGYFGLSAVSNVALLGKVMVYGMVQEAPGKYAVFIPVAESTDRPWDLVLVPPFNDANYAFAGEFARATIFHDPVRFAKEVLGTAISTAGEHDSVFVHIDNNAPFGRWLQVLLAIDLIRYRGFVILTALATAWMLAAVIAPGTNQRIQIMGTLGLIVMYGWLITAAVTFGEFERVRKTINPIGTAILLGTFLLTLRLALTYRDKMIPAIGLIGLELAAIGLLPRLSSTEFSAAVLLAIALFQTVAIVRWSGPLTNMERT
jgi:hypothetical protein